MSHHGSPFKQTRQDEHPFDMSQESMTTSDSAFSRQSFGKLPVVWVYVGAALRRC